MPAPDSDDLGHGPCATAPTPQEAELWMLRHGAALPPAVRLPLRAGPLSLVFEEGDLRYIRVGRIELIRRIYVMVRDQHWNTFPPRIIRLKTQLLDDRFEISYDAEHAGTVEESGHQLRFTSRVRMTGSATGAIRVELDGLSGSSFLSNRIGICVLHPAPAVCGTPIRIEHADGTVDRRVFPSAIAPYEPFTDIAGMLGEPLPGLQSTLPL